MRRLNLVLVVGVLVLVLRLAAYYRFSGLAHRGMTFHGDCWNYLDVAKQWAEGKVAWLYGDGFYRPAIHLLQGLAVRLWGYNDYSIKVLNALLDMGSLCLMIAVAWLLTGTAWAGVVTALLYGFLPWVINTQVLQEFPHGPATFFVLLSLLSYTLGSRAAARPVNERFLLAGTGLSLGVMANMHGDLALLGPGYICVLALSALQGRSVREAFKPFLVSAAILTGAFFLPYLVGIACFGPREVLKVFSNEFLHMTACYKPDEGPSWLPTWPAMLIYDSLGSIYGHTAMVYVFAGAVVLAAVRPLYRAKYFPAGYAPLILVLGYAVLYGATIGPLRPYMWRVFLPLFPLVLVTVTYWYYTVLKTLLGRYATLALVGLAAIFVACTPHVRSPFRSNTHRLAYDLLRGRVNESNKLLVLPVIAPFSYLGNKPNPWGLGHDVYFGTNALTLTSVRDFSFPYTVDSLEAIALTHDVRYVLVYRNNLEQEALLQKFPRFGAIGVAGEPYSLEKELALIEQFLDAHLAKKIGDFQAGLFEMGRPAALKAWEFNELDPSEWEWQMPDGTRHEPAEGAVCEATLGREKWLSLRRVAFPATDLLGMRMVCFWQYPEKNVRAPAPRVAVFWARAEDEVAGWPYAEERARSLRQTDMALPNLFQTRFEGHPNWNGTITDIGIRVTLPSPDQGTSQTGKARVVIQSIVLLKDAG